MHSEAFCTALETNPKTHGFLWACRSPFEAAACQTSFVAFTQRGRNNDSFELSTFLPPACEHQASNQALWRLRQEDSAGLRQPGSHSEFKVSLIWSRPCLKTPTPNAQNSIPTSVYSTQQGFPYPIIKERFPCPILLPTLPSRSDCRHLPCQQETKGKWTWSRLQWHSHCSCFG